MATKLGNFQRDRLAQPKDSTTGQFLLLFSIVSSKFFNPLTIFDPLSVEIETTFGLSSDRSYSVRVLSIESRTTWPSFGARHQLATKQ